MVSQSAVVIEGMEIGYWGLCYEAEFLCLGSGFAAVVHAELAVDVFEVGLDGVDGDVQRLSDLLVGLAIGEQLQDFQLTLAQRLYEWLSVGV